MQIEATCSQCRGRVQVTPKDVVLHPRLAVIEFICPVCWMVSRNKVPSQGTLDRLIESMLPQPTAPVLPPFTLDELIDFHFNLDKELEELFR